MSKADPRMAAIGDVDEANSAIGMVRAVLTPEQQASGIEAMLARVQNDLFDLGADFATPAGIEGALRIEPSHVAWLERAIDELNDPLAPLRSFVLPAGNPAAAALHLARAVTRRAERTAVAAAAEAELSGQALTYINRLSDFLFVAARSVNQSGAGDVLWVPGASR